MGAAGLFLLAWRRPFPPAAKIGPLLAVSAGTLAAACLGAALVFAGVPLQNMADDLPLAGMLVLIVLPAFVTCLWLGSALGSAYHI